MSGVAHRGLLATVLLYAVARGVIDHVRGRPDVAARAHDARHDLERRLLNARINDFRGSVADHLIWTRRMAAANVWDAYAGSGHRSSGVPLPLPHAHPSGRMILDPETPGRGFLHEEISRHPYDYAAAARNLSGSLARGHGASGSVMGPSKREPLTHEEVEAVRTTTEGGAWATAIRDQALGLLTDEWQTFPQLMARYEGSTRPALLRRALVDDSRCEVRDALGLGLVGGMEYRRAFVMTDDTEPPFRVKPPLSLPTLAEGERWPEGWQPTRLERDIARGWVIHHMTRGGMRIWRRTRAG